MDGTKPIHEAIFIGYQGQKIKIQVKHENFPLYFMHCFKVGHSSNSCCIKNSYLKPIVHENILKERPYGTISDPEHGGKDSFEGWPLWKTSKYHIRM